MMPRMKLMATPMKPMVSEMRAPDEQARKHVAPQPVGAEQEERAVLGRADEMEVAVEQAPELVVLARAEEADAAAPWPVSGVYSRFSVSMLSWYLSP